jgi:streptomycin 6-kinase
MAGARGWIEQLTDLAAALADEWEVTPGSSIEGWTESFVIEVSLVNGIPTVLQLLIPSDFEAAGDEITVLQLANGEGCPQLFRQDRTRRALLMERVGRSMFDLSVPLLQVRRLASWLDSGGVYLRFSTIQVSGR